MANFWAGISLYVLSGASAGIGKETALDLAKRGAKVCIFLKLLKFQFIFLENYCYFLFEKVIICSRNETKAEEAIKYIKQESGNDSVQFCHLDLASLKVKYSCN